MNKKDYINKLLIFIIILFGFSSVGLGIYYFFFYVDEEITCSLNGLETNYIVINQSFIDSGITCMDSNNNDYSNYVTTNNGLDNTKIGVYHITYNFKYKMLKQEFTRNIIVTENPYANVDIQVDNDTIYLMKNNELVIPKYIVLKDNKETGNFYVDVTNNVDNNNIGEYEIKYFIKNDITKIEKKVKVIVYDLAYDERISTKEKTKDDVEITYTFTNDNYSYMILPDNTKVYDNIVTYKISKNGNYKFIIYDKYNNYKEIEHVINNIYSDYKCDVKIDRYGTNGIVTVDGKNDIKNYYWIVKGVSTKGENTYKNSKKAISDIKVKLEFNDNDTLDLNCTVTNNLKYTFKYDANFSKPYLKCNSYTSSDKTKLDKQLSDAINDAGYGTRAGVVEAARFLTGALDYKVKYLGPKQIDSQLGRYQKIGLNIGVKNAWGCMVSGWTQGMDCTNFVDWAFIQNGLRSPGYSSYVKTIPNKDKLKVGDLVYTPNSSKPYGISHVGMVVGRENDTIYVAESTTGNIDAIVITKWDINSLTSGKFSIFHITNYPSEGKLTNMWVEKD